MKVIEPFVDKKGDVSAFQEVRTSKAVEISKAVWVLTTHRDSKSGDPIIPGIDSFIRTYGKTFSILLAQNSPNGRAQ